MQNNWKEPRSILMSSADRVAHRWATHAIIAVNTHALPWSINAQLNKTEQSIYECLLGFCFKQHFLRRHKFWLHRQFSSPIQKRRNDG